MRKNRLYSIAFGCSLLFLLFFSLLLYNAIHSMTTFSRAVEHSHQVMFNLQKLWANVIDIETSQRGFLITQDSTFLQPLFIARDNVPDVLDTLLVFFVQIMQYKKTILSYSDHRLFKDWLQYSRSSTKVIFLR